LTRRRRQATTQSRCGGEYVADGTRGGESACGGCGVVERGPCYSGHQARNACKGRVMLQGHLGILNGGRVGAGREVTTPWRPARRNTDRRVSTPPLPRTRRCRRGPPRAIIARVHSVARPSYQDCCCVRRRKMHARRPPCAWIAHRHRHALAVAVRGGARTAAVTHHSLPPPTAAPRASVRRR
jgi:hypothetical protein